MDGQLVRGAGSEIGLAAYEQWVVGYAMVSDQVFFLLVLLLVRHPQKKWSLAKFLTYPENYILLFYFLIL